MRHSGTLLDVWEGKLELAVRVFGEANVMVLQDIPYQSECIVINATYIMNQISTKPLWIKIGSDLAAKFCKHVDHQFGGAETVVIDFEWYSDDMVRQSCQRKVKKQNKLPDTGFRKRYRKYL